MAQLQSVLRQGEGITNAWPGPGPQPTSLFHGTRNIGTGLQSDPVQLGSKSAGSVRSGLPHWAWQSPWFIHPT
jgi:hypothetical protein